MRQLRAVIASLNDARPTSTLTTPGPVQRLRRHGRSSALLGIPSSAPCSPSRRPRAAPRRHRPVHRRPRPAPHPVDLALLPVDLAQLPVVLALLPILLLRISPCSPSRCSPSRRPRARLGLKHLRRHHLLAADTGIQAVHPGLISAPDVASISHCHRFGVQGNRYIYVSMCGYCINKI
jgi:hypothetical protein